MQRDIKNIMYKKIIIIAVRSFMEQLFKKQGQSSRQIATKLQIQLNWTHICSVECTEMKNKPKLKSSHIASL